MMGIIKHHPMKTLIVLFTFGALLAAPTFLEAKIIRTVEKTFNVPAGGLLKVQTFGGDIDVQTGTSDSEVKVTAKQRINADAEGKADELLKDLILTIEEHGGNVTGSAKYAKTGGWHLGSTPVTVSFVVSTAIDFISQSPHPQSAAGYIASLRWR